MVSVGAAAFMAAWMVEKPAAGHSVALSSTTSVAALALILKNNDKKSRVATVIDLILKILKPASFRENRLRENTHGLKENTDLVIILQDY
jgi:hypothetical protein